MKNRPITEAPNITAVELWAHLKALGHEVTAKEVLEEWIRQTILEERTPLQRLSKREK